MHNSLTHESSGLSIVARMDNVTKIHAGKTPNRIHFIPEWAEKCGLSQADIVREIGADKSLVSRWYSGTKPGDEYLRKLAALLVHQDKETADPDTNALFRHPDDDWLMKFFKERSQADKEKAIDMLRVMFGEVASAGKR